MTTPAETSQAGLNHSDEPSRASIRHTPGPWTMVEPEAVDYRAPVVFGRGASSRVATMDAGGPDRAIGSPEARANARLIAAAPDLLEALSDAYRFISAPQRMDTPKGGPKTATYRVENYNALTAKLRAAISKATALTPSSEGGGE